VTDQERTTILQVLREARAALTERTIREDPTLIRDLLQYEKRPELRDLIYSREVLSWWDQHWELFSREESSKESMHRHFSEVLRNLLMRLQEDPVASSSMDPKIVRDLIQRKRKALKKLQEEGDKHEYWLNRLQAEQERDNRIIERKIEEYSDSSSES
jgi:tRNA-dihydrouridine synthase